MQVALFPRAQHDIIRGEKRTRLKECDFIYVRDVNKKKTIKINGVEEEETNKKAKHQKKDKEQHKI